MREILSIYFLHSLLIARSYDDGGECGSLTDWEHGTPANFIDSDFEIFFKFG